MKYRKRLGLQIYYTCRKCKKDYSKEEYAHSKFCKECGSYLLMTFKREEKTLAPQVEKSAFQRAAESLRNRIGSSKEFEVVPETEKAQPTASSFDSWMWSSEYDEALKLEKMLTKKYKGKTLEDAIPGEVVSNESRGMLCYFCFLHFKLQKSHL
jgi:DNA-directed RNA polymerase subunit RPC12/RpoP